MKKSTLTKADKAEMDRLKLTKAERAAVIDHNIQTQEEKDKINAQVALDIADKNKADKLTKAYNSDPELWRSKNSVRFNVSLFIASLFPDNLSVQANLIANYDGRVRELSRPQDTALELVLVEQVAASHTRLQLVSMLCPLNVKTVALSDYMDRRLEAATRRFDRDCLTLARVRRLALPVLLVNIGHKQQVNVGFVSKALKGKAPKGETQ